MHLRKWALIAVSTLIAPVTASAVPIVTAGNYNLQPNQPNQPVSISVTGGDAVQGVELNARIGTGLGAIPKFTGGTVITGTIFASNNQGDFGDGVIGNGTSIPQILNLATATTGVTTVAASGLLGTLIIDTTGLNAGTYALTLSNTENGPTVLTRPGNISTTTVIDGSITIVPEPATAGLLVLSTGGLLLRRRRFA